MNEASSPLRGLLDRPRPVLLLLAILGAAFWAYVSIRAATLSFTFDESLSYRIIAVPGNRWWGTANNHILNTLLMKLSQLTLGEGELSLRLGNVLAHLGYVVCSALCLRRVASGLVFVAGFVLLQVNPFMLDFFGLARGYGLSWGFMMASLWCFLEGVHAGTPRRWYAASLALSGLAIWSSWSLLNYHLALVGVVFLREASRWRASDDPEERARIRRDGIWLGGLALVILASALPVVIWLKLEEEFFFGGSRGFVHDTVQYVIDGTLYQRPRLDTWLGPLSLVVVAWFAVVAGLSAAMSWRRRELLPSAYLWVIVFVCALSTIVQHHLLTTPYPPGRAALYLVPPFLLSTVLVVDETSRDGALGQRIAAYSLLLVVGAPLLWNFARAANLKTTFNWYYDADTKQMLSDLERDVLKRNPSDPVTIGFNMQNRWAIDYYRRSRKLEWLSPTVMSGKPYDWTYDYYYLPRSRHNRMAKIYELEEIARYPTSGRKLSRRLGPVTVTP